MLACKGIFAKPSIPQASSASGVEDAKACIARLFCGYYTIFPVYVQTEKRSPTAPYGSRGPISGPDQFFAFILLNIPLITIVIDVMTGVATTRSVAILTLAENAIGRSPNPTFDGPSRLFFRAMR